MCDSFNALYKEFRNRLRKFRPSSIVDVALQTLREPAADKIAALQRAPWQIMLIVKWALQDRMCSDLTGRQITRQEFDDLRQRLWNFPDRMNNAIDGGLRLNLRRIFRPQVPFQREESKSFVREAALLETTERHHPLRRLFEETTGLTPQQFIDLSLATYTSILTHNQHAIPLTWYSPLLPRIPAATIDAYIKLVSRTYDELQAYCRSLPEN